MRLVSAASQGSCCAVLAGPELPAHRGLPDVGTAWPPGTVPHLRGEPASHGQRRSPTDGHGANERLVSNAVSLYSASGAGGVLFPDSAPFCSLRALANRQHHLARR